MSIVIQVFFYKFFPPICEPVTFSALPLDHVSFLVSESLAVMYINLYMIYLLCFQDVTSVIME